jgi:hypothetical protein
MVMVSVGFDKIWLKDQRTSTTTDNDVALVKVGEFTWEGTARCQRLVIE